jgi:hypothetical protein
LADPALAARLLGADMSTLLDDSVAVPGVPRRASLPGALFESLVALSVRVYAQAAEATVQHLRTRGGEHEVDLWWWPGPTGASSRSRSSWRRQ